MQMIDGIEEPKFKKKIKETNFYLVNEFIWVVMQDFCDLKTFLKFNYICKDSYRSIPHKEEHFKKKLFEDFGIDLQISKEKNMVYNFNIQDLPYLKLTFFIKKYEIQVRSIENEHKYNYINHENNSIIFHGKYSISMIYSQNKVSFWRYDYEENSQPFNIVYTYNWQKFKWDCSQMFINKKMEKIKFSFLVYGIFVTEQFDLDENLMISYFNEHLNIKWRDPNISESSNICSEYLKFSEKTMETYYEKRRSYFFYRLSGFRETAKSFLDEVKVYYKNIRKND